ncbi:MAG TPA: NAD-dependent epimerase/dehydratase family protein [Verrucomicrobiae bacterium]|nr:NAD-dependent epimerase/dehydratase family protein [Verrucomicrobiae bacterium]
MSNIVVIGGAGFVGSHLVERLAERGATVHVLDDLATGRREYVSACSGVTFGRCDIVDRTDLAEAVVRWRPVAVVHLAAIHHIPTCENEPHLALRTNIEGTQNVADACRAAGVRRLVFASSGAVYDILEGPLAETMSVRPRDIYGICKAAGEQLMTYAHRAGLPEVAVVRLFNTVGTRETNRHLIPDVVAQLVAGKRRIAMGNTSPRRDFVHVEDVADAFATLAEAPLPSSFGVYNVGSGTEYSAADVVRLLGETIGEAVEIDERPELKRRVDRHCQLADIAKIQALVPGYPRRSLAQALREIWAEATGGGAS